MTNNTALIYGRVSTDRQENSLDVQDNRCTDYAHYQHLQIISTLTDEDISGSMPIALRPGGSVVMDLLTRGLRDDTLPLCIPPEPVKHIVVSKLDRLGRNAQDLLGFWDWCQAQGVVIHIVEMGIQSDSMYGKLMYQIFAVFAEFERDTIRDRVNSTIDKKFKAGESIGNLPYGFDRTGTEEGDTKFIEDNAQEQSWIRQMDEWKSLGMSTSKIALELNRLSVPTKQGVTWNGAKVHRVLHSRHTRERVLKIPGPEIKETERI